MADVKRNFGPQEQKDLNKFLKFLSLKAVQVIVQSRLGNKIHTKSKPRAMGQDWFNLAVDDIPEVVAETKAAMNNQLPSKDNPMCVEISLKTSEGDSMILEMWCLTMNDRVDPNAKVTYTVYNRMGILLKSLASVSRVIPAYRLARKQGPDFVMCYRVYFGDARVQELGDGFHSLRVGSVGTPIGSVSLSTAYRTKLTLPERSTVQVTSDYYCAEPEVPGPSSALPVDTRRHVIADEIASAAATEVTCSRSPPRASEPISAPSQHQPRPATAAVRTHSGTPPRRKPSPRLSTSPQAVKASGSRTRCAFASSPSTAELPDLPALSSTPPFASLLIKPGKPSPPDAVARRPLDKRPGNAKRSEARSQDHPAHPTAPSFLAADDEFVMVELRPAFASHSGAAGDLGSFYRECQTAPPLELFSNLQLDDGLENLEGELSGFRENAATFDELLADLQQEQIY